MTLKLLGSILRAQGIIRKWPVNDENILNMNTHLCLIAVVIEFSRTCKHTPIICKKINEYGKATGDSKKQPLSRWVGHQTTSCRYIRTL